MRNIVVAVAFFLGLGAMAAKGYICYAQGEIDGKVHSFSGFGETKEEAMDNALAICEIRKGKDCGPYIKEDGKPADCVEKKD